MQANEIKWQREGSRGTTGFYIIKKSDKGEYRVQLRRKEHYILATIFKIEGKYSWDKEYKMVDQSKYPNYKTAKERAVRDLNELLLTGDLM